jgi:hypothetical protein
VTKVVPQAPRAELPNPSVSCAPKCPSTRPNRAKTRQVRPTLPARPRRSRAPTSVLPRRKETSKQPFLFPTFFSIEADDINSFEAGRRSCPSLSSAPSHLLSLSIKGAVHRAIPFRLPVSLSHAPLHCLLVCVCVRTIAPLAVIGGPTPSPSSVKTSPLRRMPAQNAVEPSEAATPGNFYRPNPSARRPSLLTHRSTHRK